LQYLIVLFYLWAGTLKLNHEWISGLGLYGVRPLGLPEALIPAACLYVIVLELGIVLGLLSRRDWFFWTAFGQLLLFHLASYWVVGFFYPLLMLLLLAIYPLARYLPPPASDTARGPIGFSAIVRGRESLATYSVVLGFSFAQCVPLMFPGDTALTGEGRMFALHMFDAPVECHATATVQTSGAPAKVLPMEMPDLTARVECDPLVYFDLAQDFCRAHDGRPDRADVDVLLESRRQGQGLFKTIVALQAVCSNRPTYSAWRHNPWIRPAK
jgi:hypothetical protein